MLEGSARGFPSYTLQTEIAEWAQTIADRGATLSDARRNMNDSLVVSLKAAGIWSKLDRLYIPAAENTTAALMDLTRRANALVTTVIFTVDQGYTGIGGGISDQYFTDFVPGMAANPNYTTDAACYFAWNNTLGQSTNNFVGLSSIRSNIIIEDTGGILSWSINNAASTWTTFSRTATRGLYLCNRTSSTASTLDVDGVQISSASFTSEASTNQPFGCVRDTRQVCCFGCGASLSATERVAIFNILRAYMTNLGVP